MTGEELSAAVAAEEHEAGRLAYIPTCVRLHPAAIPGSVVFIPTAAGEGEIYVHPDDFDSAVQDLKRGRFSIRNRTGLRGAFINGLPVLRQEAA